MNAISASQSSIASSQTAASRLLASSQSQAQSPVRESQQDAKATFQDFVAGTFYKEMLKSLQKMHGKAAYMNGGQAEKIFQSQMDQQVAENLAHSHSGQFADALYESFARTGGRG